MVKKPILIAIAVLAGAGVFALLVQSQGASRVETAPPAAFDATRWSQLNARDSGEERLAMGLELMQSLSLGGKTHAEVLSLLGQDCYRDPSGSLTYELRKTYGQDGKVIGTDDMLVLFGRDGRVNEARHLEWHGN